MSHKADKYKLPESLDRRRKLPEDTKDEIRERYQMGGETYRSLAEEYGISHGMVGIIVNPKRAAAVKKRISDNWKANYDKDAHREAMQKTRAYKQKLIEEGRIQPQDKREL